MRVCRTKQELKEALSGVRGHGFVPTMGAFHEGHLHLMRTCADQTGLCVVSLFVNPLQFGPGEDYLKYPRDEARDFELASKNGCAAMFSPSPEELYGDSKTKIHVGGLSEVFEGAFRPGHFDGVATVVAKLFGLVGPERAYFGLKDLQQCAVLKQMVRDLDIQVQLEFVETLREDSGLALSSRNIYLDKGSRALASEVISTMKRIRSALSKQENRVQARIDEILEVERVHLTSRGFKLDYLEVVDPWTMATLRSWSNEAHLITAVRLGGVRLIDNLKLVGE